MYNTQSSVSSLNMKFLQNLLLFFFFSKFRFSSHAHQYTDFYGVDLALDHNGR